jgi:hypothetical protein
VHHNSRHTLNLRSTKFYDLGNLQNEVEMILDKFLRAFLLSKHSKPILFIIVGRGLNSKTFINDKHPLRFYTENYLDKVGLFWKNNLLNPGVIEVYL